jgi:hypothetical protein
MAEIECVKEVYLFGNDMRLPPAEEVSPLSPNGKNSDLRIRVILKPDHCLPDDIIVKAAAEPPIGSNNHETDPFGFTLHKERMPVMIGHDRGQVPHQVP